MQCGCAAASCSAAAHYSRTVQGCQAGSGCPWGCRATRQRRRLGSTRRPHTHPESTQKAAQVEQEPPAPTAAQGGGGPTLAPHGCRPGASVSLTPQGRGPAQDPAAELPAGLAASSGAGNGAARPTAGFGLGGSPRRGGGVCPGVLVWVHVCACRVRGMSMVCAWSVHGAWHVHGVFMACAWHVHGICIACVWRVHGVCMACACTWEGCM